MTKKDQAPAAAGRGPDYLSYLLRLWRAEDDGQAVWRASLKNPLTRDCQGFTDLGELFAYLESQITETDDPNHESSDEVWVTPESS